MVFYLKYRSQKISELDNEKLREKLYGIFTSNNIPHSFLFTGPKGLGKTSTARIIAKIVNCQKNAFATGKEKTPETIEPCNTCEACISITNGSNIDVLEIDGASNRGIDEIRDLREKVRLLPSNLRKKVYIIDEVHMLTNEAFNALLKTIEEPPPHALFIFCTTEPHKVPGTILSRCLHIGLTLATQKELVHALSRVAKGENLAVTEESLALIASLAEGGFRDGVKIFEEIVALAHGREITKELIEEKYHVQSITLQVTSLLRYLQEKKMKEALLLIGELVENGTEVKYFISQLLIALHEVLLQTIGIEESTPTLKLSVEEIQNLVSLLSEAYAQIKYAVIPQLSLELAVVAWCNTGQREELTKREKTEQDDKPTIHTLLKKQHAIQVKTILTGGEKKSTEKPEPQGSQNDIASHPTEAGSNLLENLIYKIKPQNHSLTGVLRGCKILAMTDTQVVIEAPYAFHKERLEEAKSFTLIEQAIQEITGKMQKIVVELKK